MTTRSVFRTWWPLAASWLLMGFELPAVSAIVARLAHPEINLAAFGGVVFPLSMFVEAPIIMLLSASTALCRDRDAYRLIRRFMLIAGASLTGIHLAIVLTPLYDVVVGGWIGAPEPIRGPARLGLLIMTPWTWSIAYRRFQQGVLIRSGRSRAVGAGTAVRLATEVLMLTAGYALGKLPGIVVGAAAVASGVMAEALFIGWKVRPVLRQGLPARNPAEPPLTFRAFLDFYVPLAMTSLLTMTAAPIASAAMSRMPRAIESLAAWPVVNGLVFTLRSVGFAFNEVVVALLERPRSVAPLRRFATGLAIATSMTLLLVAGTPLAGFWLVRVSALAPPLAALARGALYLALLMPATSVFQSWFQGTIVHGRRTRPVTESVLIYLLTTALILGAGVRLGRLAGLYVGVFGIAAGNLAQVGWLAFRARPFIRAVEARDAAQMCSATQPPTERARSTAAASSRENRT
jgi:hypothetical protein